MHFILLIKTKKKEALCWYKSSSTETHWQKRHDSYPRGIIIGISTAYILTRLIRQITDVTNNTNDEETKWNLAVINFIIYACAFPTATSQLVFSEIFWWNRPAVIILHKPESASMRGPCHADYLVALLYTVILYSDYTLIKDPIQHGNCNLE